MYGWMAAKNDFVLLDIRSPAEYEAVRLPWAISIPFGTLRERIDELPKDKEIVTFYMVSLRSYEAAWIFQTALFKKVRVMDGGLSAWPPRFAPTLSADLVACRTPMFLPTPRPASPRQLLKTP